MLLFSPAPAVLCKLPRVGDIVLTRIRLDEELSDMSLTAVVFRMDRGDITMRLPVNIPRLVRRFCLQFTPERGV